MSGITHFSSSSIQYAAASGVPMASFLVPFSGIMACVGGLMIIFGFKAKIGAWLIVLFLVPVTLAMHNFWAVEDPMMHQMQMAMFMKNLAMLGGALIITHFGSGPLSLDNKMKK
jgi:putative oxidoreductase